MRLLLNNDLSYECNKYARIGIKWMAFLEVWIASRQFSFRYLFEIIFVSFNINFKKTIEIKKNVKLY